MFYFAIPLISRQASHDWSAVESLLTDTLASILHSTTRDFRVLIACHDVPDTPYNADDKVKFLQVAFPPLMGRNRPMLDKIHKLRTAALEARQSGPGYIMLMDADDLISKRLVEYVLADQDPYGYVISKGYELDYATGRVKWCPRYHLLCGSSVIAKVSLDDLPQSLEDEHSYFSSMIQGGHRMCEARSRDMGRPLRRIPFPAGMYIINNGENHSKRTHNIGTMRKIVRFLTPSIRVNERLRDEFGFRIAPLA